jgi:hypothetical protein
MTTDVQRLTDAVADVFAPGGLLSQHRPGYEARPHWKIPLTVGI